MATAAGVIKPAGHCSDSEKEKKKLLVAQSKAKQSPGVS
jgi:hypothetical protein